VGGGCILSITPCWPPHRVVKGPRFEAWTRNHKPEPGSSLTFIFEARLRPESQIYQGISDMRNCRVTKNVVFGYSCRYTVDHTQNNNNLDQNIGIIWHKRSMIPNDNTAQYNVSQKKETVRDGAIGMTSRLVGFLKQAKNRVSDWSLWDKATACLFPHRCRLLKISVRLILAEKKRTQLCLQTELAEKNHSHFTHRSYRGEHNKSTSRKKKIVTPNEGFVCRPEIFWQAKSEPRPIQKARPDLQLCTMLKVSFYELQVNIQVGKQCRVLLQRFEWNPVH